MGKFASGLQHSTGCIILALTVLLALCGCGVSDPFDYVKVRGKVTYDDGSPIPARLHVTFVPQSPPHDLKTHPRPGVAEIDGGDGTFDVVTSHRFGDGIVRGAHKVTVMSLDENLNPTSDVPAVYGDADTTPLTIESANSPFHLKIRKPEWLITCD